MNTLNIYPSNNAGSDCAPHKLASAEKSHTSMKMLTITQDEHRMYCQHLTPSPLVLKSRSMTNRPKWHKIWGLHSSAAAQSSRLGCDAVLLVSTFQCRRTIVVPLKCWELLTYWPTDRAQHSRRLASADDNQSTLVQNKGDTHSSKTAMYKYVTICTTPPNTTNCNYIHIPF
jgi:hypothetical protein